MPNVQLRSKSDTCGIATFDNVVLVAWLGASSVATIDEVHRLSAELTQKHPGGIAHVNLVPRENIEAGGISNEMRERIVRLLRDPSLELLSSVVVYPGEGFVAAMIRSLLAGASLLARSSASLKIVRTSDEADRFLRGLFGKKGAKPLAPGALTRAVGEFRGLLGPAGAAL